MRIKLGTKINDKKTGKPITHAVTDSREAAAGDLFFPLKGKNDDGNNYIADALSKGAIVSDISLTEFASLYKKSLPKLLYTIAITGSVGKTTTKEFLLRICQKQFKTHATPGNYNNEIGLPLSIISAPEDTEVLILEMGTSGSGEIERLSRCAEPNIALITNIGTSHIGAFGSREEIAKEKLSVRAGLGKGKLLIPYGEDLLDGESDYRFSSSSRWARVALLQSKNGSLDLYIHGKHCLTARSSLSASHLTECLAGACAAAHYIGVSAGNIKNGIENIGSDCVRHKLITAGGVNILDDSYNASRESVLADLYMMKELDYGERSLLLGDILELGKESERIHREIGRETVKLGLARLYLFGNLAAFTGREAESQGFPPERIFYNTDTEHPEITAEEIKRQESEGSVVLFKASNAIKLARVTECLRRD